MSIDYGKYIEEKEGKFYIKGLYNSNYSVEDNRDRINIFQILHYLRTNKNYKNKEIIIVEGIYLSSLKDIKNLSKEENINPEKINNRLKIIFKENVIILDCNIKDGVNFGGCIFEQEVNFNGSAFEKDIYFNRSIFEQEAKFHNTQFLENIRFHECKFKGVTIFNNTKFEKLADFYEATFSQPQQFHLVDFFDRAVFSNAIFKEECQFLFCRVSKDSHINFESATFNKGLDISRSNFTCDVNFWNITIYEKNKESGEHIFSSEKYQYDFDAKNENISIPKKIRESYRFIKNNLYNQNDKISGLEYQKREMEAYWKELNLIREQKQPKKSERKLIITNIIGGFVVSLFLVLYSFREYKVYFWLSLISFLGTFYISFRQKGIGINLKNIKNNRIKKPLFSVSSIILILIVAFLILIFRDLYYLKNNLKFYIIVLALTFIITLLALLDYEKDRYLLLFNRYSNDFGTNWVRGVTFTLVVSLIFYAIFIPSLNVKYDFSLTLEGVKNFVESFLAIINIIDFKPFDNEKAFIKAEDLSGWSYPILFIGRIFISYGYYQTIQAFRKFGKS